MSDIPTLDELVDFFFEKKVSPATLEAAGIPAILEDLRKSKAAEQAADREVQRLKEENELVLNSIGAESWGDAVAIFKVLRDSDEALGRYADRLRSAEVTLQSIKKGIQAWTPEHALTACEKQTLRLVDAHFSHYEEPTT